MLLHIDESWYVGVEGFLKGGFDIVLNVRVVVLLEPTRKYLDYLTAVVPPDQYMISF